MPGPLSSASKGATLPPTRDLPRVAWADRFGTVLSIGCMVHCLLTPLLLSFSVVAAHWLPSEERMHRSLAVGVAFFGALALVRGMRLHRKRRVATTMACGLLLIVFAAYLGDSLPRHWMEVLVTACGSCLMVLAHRWNHTFCQSCRQCVPGSSCRSAAPDFSAERTL